MERTYSKTRWDNVHVTISIYENEQGDFEPLGGIPHLISQVKSTLIGLGYHEDTIEQGFN